MFIIEKLIQDHHDRIEAWQNARDKWVNESSYRSRREYESEHPCPGTMIKNVLKALLLVVLVAGVATLGIFLSVQSSKHHDSKPKTTVQKHVTSVKVGDKVQVVYGDYKDSVGTVVKVSDDDAILKLSNSTLTKAMCDASHNCSTGGGTDNGQLLDVNSFKNLAPYKE